MTGMGKAGTISIIVVAGFVFCLLLGGLPFETVERGTTGVKVRFGKVLEKTYPPGLHWKTPFIESIREVNVQQANAEEHSEAASKDLQKVSTDVKVLYTVNQAQVPRAYDRIGGRQEIESTLILPAIKECFKAVTARYTAEELVTKRNEASIAIHENLASFIERSCNAEELPGLVRIDNVAVEDFKFSREFDAAIEAKVTAEQEALRAEEEKNRTITQAEAEKEKVRLASEAKALEIENEATAEAFKIKSISEARAEAIRREAEALRGNSELIQLRRVEAWDGVLPRFTGGVIPFFDVTESQLTGGGNR